jgi:hypothetical protein
MKLTTFLAVSLGTLSILGAGCREVVQPPERPPVVQAPDSPTAFPALPRAGEIYLASESLLREQNYGHHRTLVSRYVLYEDGAFELQYLRGESGFFQYRGRYTRTDTLVAFAFDNLAFAPVRDASGVLAGDSLTVRYNTAMSLSGFVDGVFVRTPPVH